MEWIAIIAFWILFFIGILFLCMYLDKRNPSHRNHTPSVGCYEFRYQRGMWTVFDTDGNVYVADRYGNRLSYEQFEDALFSIDFGQNK